MGKVIRANFNLSPEQRRFKALVLNLEPQAIKYFDFSTRELNTSRVETDLNDLPQGQRLKLAFLCNLWLNEEKFSFNILDAVSCLPKQEVNIIIIWMLKPFFP